MIEDRSKLDRWVRRQVLTLEDERGRCKKLTARHVTQGKLGSEILSLPVPKKMEDPDAWISEAIEQFNTALHDDAEGLGGVQTYIVQPYFENKAGVPGGRFTIRISGEAEDPEGVESEPATPKGLLSQLMRHNEALARTLTVTSGQVAVTQRHMLARLAEHNETLLKDRIESFALMEQLKSQDTERKMLVSREEATQKRVQDAWEKLLTLAPIVANKLLGGKVVPEKRTAIEAMVQGFMETVDEEQVIALSNVLKPHQTASLLSIFQALQESNPKKGNGSAH